MPNWELLAEALRAAERKHIMALNVCDIAAAAFEDAKAELQDAKEAKTRAKGALFDAVFEFVDET